jgi:hypothetical protein
MRRNTLFLFVVTFLSAISLSQAPAATLSGKVISPTGAPVAQALVWVTQQRQVRTLKTDGMGRFSADDIDVAFTEVVAFREGFSLGGATAVVVGDAALEIVLEARELLTLKVLDVDSNPIAGASVRSMLVEGRFLVSVEDLVPHGLPPMRSNDDGILVLTHLPKDGFIETSISHPDYVDSALRNLPVEREQRNILLQPGKRVVGRVMHDGKGVGGARVSIFRASSGGQREYAEILTDKEGFYHAQVHSNRYGVAVEHVDFAPTLPKSLEVPPNQEAEPVNFDLERPRFVRGRLLYPDKKPCGGTRVFYRVGSTIVQDTLTNNNGRFTLRIPGTAGDLIIEPPRGYQTPHDGPITVDLGDAREADLKSIRLKSLPVITGVIREDDGGEPGRVLVTTRNLPYPYQVLTDEEGNLTLPLDFMPDVRKLQLRVEHARRFQRQDIEVSLKKAKAVDVKMTPYQPDLAPRDPVPARNNLSALVGELAQPLRGTEWVNSDPINLEDLKGKVVVMLFWAGFDEDQGPIVIQEFLALYELLSDIDDVFFLGVHDAISDAYEIREYIRGYGIPFPVLRDENEQTTFSNYNIVFIPQVVILDKKGRVRYYQTDDRLLTCIKGLRRE